MITCINRIRNKSNVITHYELLEVETKRKIVLKADDLRNKLIHNQIIVNNLKLSKSCSILLTNGKDKEITGNTNVVYKIQLKEGKMMYYETLKNENKTITENEKTALDKLGGFWTEYGEGEGRLYDALADLKNIALQEYREYGRGKGLKFRKSNLASPTQEMIDIDKILGNPIDKDEQYLIVEAYNDSYTRFWRLVVKKL